MLSPGVWERGVGWGVAKWNSVPGERWETDQGWLKTGQSFLAYSFHEFAVKLFGPAMLLIAEWPREETNPLLDKQGRKRGIRHYMPWPAHASYRHRCWAVSGIHCRLADVSKSQYPLSGDYFCSPLTPSETLWSLANAQVVMPRTLHNSRTRYWK